MAVGIGLDTPSFVAIGNSFIVLPATSLSAVDDPAVAPVFMVGSGQYEGVNWVRGLCQPAVSFAGIPHDYWFTASNLSTMFTTRTNGLVASMGACAFQVGNSVATQPDIIYGQWDACYISGMTLSGGGRGTPVTASLGILPCGNYGAMPTIPSGLDLTAVKAGSAGLFMSDGVTFAATPLTNVLGWTLTLTNSLTPDTAVPGVASIDSQSRIFPARYLSGPIGVGLTLVQRAGSTVIDSLLDATNAISIDLTSIEPGGSGGRTIRFAFHGLTPAHSSGVSLGTTMVSRTYIGQAYYAGGTTFTSKIVIS